ncbi:6-phospho-3-hexuloisomerase [Tepidibacillus infernus]|uniref:6-phospho-3-hexuloisomerase n=1 Tax=Tepidibacillus infernus TaxID=1806172 RepID=UPI003B71F767
MRKLIDTIVEEMENVLSNVKEEEAISFSNYLKRVNRIFVYGEGRSGFMAKAFAMRLMHSGYHVYVIGETITPSIEKGDVLIAITGSGETDTIYQFALKAKKIEAKVGVVTTNESSKIARISDFILKIPAATKYRRPEEPDTIQPLGNQFDQAVHLLLDAIIIYLLQSETSLNADLNDELRKRHTNLE